MRMIATSLKACGTIHFFNEPEASPVDFSEVSAIADTLAALGVIASLLFVAYEVRNSTREAKRTNWEATVNRLGSYWSRTSNESLPEIIHKGRENFQNLSGPEKIVFQGHHCDFLLAMEAVFVLGANQVHEEAILVVCRRHLTFQFSFPGTRDWWNDFNATQGLSPLMTEEVQRAIGQGV
jgi:hypothetical protein